MNKSKESLTVLTRCNLISRMPHRRAGPELSSLARTKRGGGARCILQTNLHARTTAAFLAVSAQRFARRSAKTAIAASTTATATPPRRAVVAIPSEVSDASLSEAGCTSGCFGALLPSARTA